MFCNGFDLLKFSKNCQKHVVTTLTVVDSGSPRLRIRKGVDEAKNLRRTRYSSRHMQIQYQMIADRSQSQIYVKSSNGLGNMIVQSFFNNKCLKIWFLEEKHWFSTLELQYSICFCWSPKANIFGCACLKRKWVSNGREITPKSDKSDKFHN